MDEYLADNQRKAALGVPSTLDWQRYNTKIKLEFTANGDWWRNSRRYLDEVLKNAKGPRVLLYAVSLSFSHISFRRGPMIRLANDEFHG